MLQSLYTGLSKSCLLLLSSCETFQVVEKLENTPLTPRQVKTWLELMKLQLLMLKQSVQKRFKLMVGTDLS